MLRDYDVCAQYPGVVGEGATVYLPCTSVMPPRRYLIVQIDAENEHLNFCEIEVYVRRKLVFLLIYYSTANKTGMNVIVTTSKYLSAILELAVNTNVSGTAQFNFVIYSCQFQCDANQGRVVTLLNFARYRRYIGVFV